MTNLFLDTDVLMDFLTNRIPFAEDSTRIIVLGKARKIRTNATPLSFATLYSTLRKYNTRKDLVNSLSGLVEIVNVIKMNEESVKRALESDWKDIEDAIQHFSAIQYSSIEVIVTRNKKDYKDSELPVMTPKEYLDTLKHTL